MHKKIVALILLLVIALLTSVYVYAAETDIPSEPEGFETEQGSDSQQTVVVEMPENMVVDVSEGSVQAIAEAVTGSEEEDQIDTVNISEESIQAIAEAVSSQSDYVPVNDYQYYLTLSTGFEVVIDTDVPDLLTDYYVSVIRRDRTDGAFAFSIYIYDDLPALGSLDSNNKYRSQPVYYLFSEFLLRPSEPCAVVIDEFSDKTSYTNLYIEFDGNNIFYSNHHWLDPDDGHVVYYSPFDKPVSYTIDFVTNIDGLVIDSQSSNNFLLPNPVYNGYIFAGWYLDDSFTTLYTSDYEITSDITLFAKWVTLSTMPDFASCVFDSFTIFFASEPIVYMMSLFGLCIIFGVLRSIVISRV